MIRLCDQIGVVSNEIPHLEFDRKRYNQIRKDNGSTRNVDRSLYGECDRSARTIFIDGRATKYTYDEYLTPLGQKRKGYICKYRTVKATYLTALDCLVHELVHYRFKSMQHGYEFNERKEEILAGKRFEQHSIAAEEEEYGLYWRPRGVRSLAKRTTDERMQCIKRSAKWLETTFKIAGDIILQELLKKYCKYTNESEIESGFNLFLREKEGI